MPKMPGKRNEEYEPRLTDWTEGAKHKVVRLGITTGNWFK